VVLVLFLYEPAFDRSGVIAKQLRGELATKLLGDVFVGGFHQRFVEGSLRLTVRRVGPRGNGNLMYLATKVRLRANPLRSPRRDFDRRMALDDRLATGDCFGQLV